MTTSLSELLNGPMRAAQARRPARPSRPRDSQRSRLYSAEDAAAHAFQGWHWRQTIDNGDLQAWVDRVLAKPAIRGRWGRRRVRVDLGRNGGHANYYSMTLGAKARNPWIMLHELAHCLTAHAVDRGEIAPHGPEFAGVQLFLVEHVLGKEAARHLRIAFREGRVRSNRKAIPEVNRALLAVERPAARVRPRVGRNELEAAADTIRRAAKMGLLGDATRKPRIHALATARLLESSAKSLGRIP